MPAEAEPLLQKLRASLEEGTFIKLTLSSPGPAAEPELRNLYARLVELRAGAHLSLALRYRTRDVTKNVPLAEAGAEMARLLPGWFTQAHLFTRSGDWRWRAGGRLQASRPALTTAPLPMHDRPKARPATGTGAAWLQELGLQNAAGEPRPGATPKLRQIERFVEILGHLSADLHGAGTEPRRIVDFGAGKGYLTFALAAWLQERGVAAEITGLELREKLVTDGNALARRAGLSGLRFLSGTIRTYQPVEPPHWVIALHACDTATDEAIAHGIAAGAELIVVAPCCHHEVRPLLRSPAVLQPMLRHGILLAREAAQVTDTLRALVLEACGYQTSIIEFIAPEHTDKNLLLTARRRPGSPDAETPARQLRELMDFYGLSTQHLVRWWQGRPAAGD